jgi:hypothetical protein
LAKNLFKKQAQNFLFKFFAARSATFLVNLAQIKKVWPPLVYTDIILGQQYMKNNNTVIVIGLYCFYRDNNTAKTIIPLLLLVFTVFTGTTIQEKQ